MKKVALSLASVLVATAFAPEASAVPAFARQTGMACNACHFQHFPLLNAFGRAFKSSGFTMMGAQGKVEGEHLSIPAQLNMNVLATAGWQTESNSGRVTTPGGNTSNSGVLLPNQGGELSLFFGGRVTENAGFLSELAFPDNAPVTSAAKLMLLWDVGSNTRAGAVVMSNQDPSYSFETLNTGANSAHRLMGNRGPANQHINVTSAHQYLGVVKGNGVSALITNPSVGFINIGKYTTVPAALSVTGAPQNQTDTFNQTYIRGAYLFEAAGWDAAVGIQNYSGKDSTDRALTAAAALDTRQTVIDGQMQGEAGGMPLGIYASYGTAPTSTNGNVFNGGTANTTLANPGATSKRSFNIAAELGVIPHKATLQLAFRSARTGWGTLPAALAVVNATGDNDNAVMIGGTYELAQNMELSLTHTSQSGSAWSPAAGGQENIGKTATTFLLETLF